MFYLFLMLVVPPVLYLTLDLLKKNDGRDPAWLRLLVNVVFLYILIVSVLFSREVILFIGAGILTQVLVMIAAFIAVSYYLIKNLPIVERKK